MEGATVAEGEGPGFLAGELVDGVEVDRGLLLGLSTTEEGDSGNCRGNGAAQGRDRGGGDLLGCGLLRAALAGGDHVGLEKGALEVDVVVGQGLVDRSEDLLGDLLAPLEVVVAVGKDLGLDDRHYSGALADGRVAGQDVGVLEDGQLGGAVLLDLEDATPLGEVATILLVLDATGLEIVKTLGRALVVGSEKWDHTGVDLDSRNDVTLLQEVDERGSIVGLLVQGLVKQDHARNVLADDILFNDE